MSRIVIRAPEYFPRLSYFALLMHADQVVLADTFQYSRQSFLNRARIRTPQGWQWISVPLLGGQKGKPLTEAQIDRHAPWRRKHWRALEYNYRTSPYFEFYELDFEPLFKQEWETLAALNIATITILCRLLSVDTPVVRASELPGSPSTLPDIFARFSGAERLLTVPESAAHDQAEGLPIEVLDFQHPTYRQNFEGFEPEMSALDLLFNYGPEARSFLERYTHIYEPTSG